MKTPFRYPGAKTRMVEATLKPAIGYVDSSWTFVDAFVGGGSVFMYAWDSFHPHEIVINDLDSSISAFWTCVVDIQLCSKLTDKILNTVPTVLEHTQQRKLVTSPDIVEKGFAAFFLNRTSFSGILKSGPIGGYEQKSRYKVGCRYNAKLLCETVRLLGEQLFGKMVVHNEDFELLIQKFDKDKVLIYCDPPYFVKGNQLYHHKMGFDDHERLCATLKALKNAKFILTYDNAPEITAMYSWAEIVEIPVRYSISGKDRNSWDENTEVIIHNFPRRTV